MHTAEALTRQIQQASDLVDVISRYVRLTRAGKDFRGLCPFHKEKTPSFYVVPSKQIFKCFGCSAGGDVFKFIQLREGVNFVEARRILAERAGIRVDQPAAGRTTDAPDRADLARVNDWALRWFRKQLASPAGESARSYALGRGLSPETIERAGLGFAPDSWNALTSAAAAQRIAPRLLIAAGLARPRQEGEPYDTFRHRLIFPIRDAMDRVIGFGGRTLGDDPAKYLNTPQTVLFDKSRALFGIDRAKDDISHHGEVIVVEGYTDCLMAHQHGFQRTVATLGTAMTQFHADMLRRYADRVVLVFDSDEAGQRAADRVLPLILAQRLDVRIAAVPEGKDPCEYLTLGGAAAFDQVLKDGVDALEFKWQALQRQYNESSGGPGRLRAIEDFLGLIGDAADTGAIDPIQRGLVVNRIAKLLGIEREELHHRLKSRVRRRPAEAPGDAPAVDGSRSSDPVSVATRELLEVLINEPGYYPTLAHHFDPHRLPEPLCRVGQCVAQLAEEIGEFTLVDLLGRIDDVATSNWIMRLQADGERRGNYEAAVAGAVARLEFESRRAAERGLRDAFRPQSESSQEMDSKVRESGELLRQRRHFLPSRSVGRRIDQAASNPGA